jgi:hypothetical protein
LTRAACTIVSPNYLAFARTLAVSYLAHHPGHRFFVLIVADLHDQTPFASEPFTAILLPHLGVPNLRSVALMYDILELNTNVKPTFMKHLLEAHGLDSLTYLDPDIFVYASLDPVHAALDAGAAAVLTPHMTTPVFDGRSPSEQDILYNGTYNLGFISVDHSPTSTDLLDWWERRCLDLGFSEGRTGLFVDQKWMNLAPGLFDRITILRDPGCNMAYWNLHERTITTSPSPFVIPEGDLRLSGDTDAPAFFFSILTLSSPKGKNLHFEGAEPATPSHLRFFHFSGITLTDPASLSKNTDRFTLADRPDLHSIFAAYKAAVLANKDATLEALPYGYDTLSDGTPLNRLARRLYAAHANHWSHQDPFDATGPFAAFARSHNLLAPKPTSHTAPKPTKTTWSDFNPNDRRVAAVHTLLKLALRLLGPIRYELLMRYLSHITVLRNQAAFLKPDEHAPAKHPGDRA